MDAKTAFRELWQRVFLFPGSDVELTHLARTMADVLIDLSPSTEETRASEWIRAYVCIRGEVLASETVLEWGLMSPRYETRRDKEGYLKLRPFEEVMVEQEFREKEAKKAIEELVAKGSLIKTEGLLHLPRGHL